MGMVRYAGKMVTDGREYMIERQEMEIAKYRPSKIYIPLIVKYSTSFYNWQAPYCGCPPGWVGSGRFEGRLIYLAPYI